MGRLTHPPFEDWLLSEETLTPQQANDLQAHLRTCESCRQLETGWLQVERLVRSAEMLAPVAGFSARWQARLEAQRARQHQRQSWVFFVGMGFLGLFVLAILVGIIFTLWQSPGQFLFGILHQLALVMETLGTFGFYLGDLFRIIPDFSWIGLFFFAGFATMLSVLWLAAFRQLTGVRRWVQ